MKSHDFFKVCVGVNAATSEAVGHFLFENGALGIVEHEHELHAYFKFSGDEQDILNPLFVYLRSLRDVIETDFNILVSTEVFQQRDWNAEWKSTLQPIIVSNTILVKPSWVDTPTPAPPVIIEIDPEMAFGSGEHSTTKLTLQLVEKNIRPNITLLDIGAGTGILGIGALKLGAGLVYAFDNDPVAAQTAQRNAEKNRVAPYFYTFAGTLDAIRVRSFDIITANVNRSQIVQMLPRIRTYLAHDGVCLLSGILDSEEQLIRDACKENDLVVDALLQDQEWLAFETRKR